MRILGCLAFVFMWVVCSAASAAPSWVQLGPQGPEIRTIAEDGRCPSVEIDGQVRQTQARSQADTAFPVTVCRLVVSQGASRASLGGHVLPLPHGAPHRILIFGDTGCRVKGLLVQDCNDPRLWPFATIAAKAAAFHPDLVIHVGDYYYRESPCPPLHDECVGSPYGDKWATWRTEFFDPAQPLLASAPFVFVRGNHESCARGGLGWFRLLDAAPQPLVCPAQAAPFRVTLGDLNLYVLDSADTVDISAPADAVAGFANQIQTLAADLAHRPGWILTHRPIWGLTPVARVGVIGPLEVALNATEQAAVRGRDLSAVQMVVSGHIHHFASFDFGPGRPAQLIAGTGGDIGEPADTPRIRMTSPEIDHMIATGLTFDRFGYLLLDRSGADWIGAFRDLDDRVIATCRLHRRDLTCKAANT